MNSIELEVKLELPPEVQAEEVLARLEPLLGVLPAGSESLLTDVYWDTSDERLFRQGWSLRLREGPETRRLTLKSLQSQDPDLAAREEREMELTADQPFPPIPQHEAFTEVEDWLSGQPLELLFSLQKHQLSWLLQVGAGLKLELTLDRVRVSGCPEIPEFRELELELKQGSEHDFRALAQAVRECLNLPLSQESKFRKIKNGKDRSDGAPAKALE